MDSKAIMKMTKQEMDVRVGMAKFPQDLKPRDRAMLVEVAITYGLDPLMGELTIYQGKPFVSIDGRYRAAQETGNLDGVETRPATEEERKNWKIPEGDYFYRAEVFVKGASHPFVGWGRVRTQEQGKSQGFAPVDTNPQRMAEKRAEAQALRKAFHINLPSAEDIGAIPDEPSPSYDVESTAEEIQPEVVDTQTGEIKDTALPVEEPPKKAAAKQKEELPPAAEAPKNVTPITLEQLATLQSLFTEKGWTPSDVGKYCNVTKGWRINDLKNLKSWQYEELKEQLNAATKSDKR